MKTQNNSSPKVLINFLLYSLRGIFVWFSVMMFFVFFNLISDRTGYTNLPVVFESSRAGDLNIENGHVNSWFHLNGSGFIHTDDLPLSVHYFSWIYNLFSTALILLIIHLICKILIDARKGNFLLFRNAIILRYIALLNIGGLFLNRIFIFLSQKYLSDKIEFPNIEFADTYSVFFPPWKQLSLYLFLLIIAEAFRLGAQLKEENDLTI